MGIGPEDEALPVDPGIEVVARTVDENLEAHLWVLREVDLSIHQRLNDAVIGTTVDIAKNESDAAQLCLCSQEWQHMGTTLILITFPPGDVVISEARIFVGPIIDGSVETCLKPYVAQRLVREMGLQPKARKSVSRNLLAFKLIVLEECKCVGINSKDAHIIGGEPIVGTHQFHSQILSLKAQERG